jgi:hypothetical protein
MSDCPHAEEIDLADMYQRWAKVMSDAWALSFESSLVVALRAGKIAAGGEAARTEMNLMVAEKAEAAFFLQNRAASGQLGANAVDVSSNAIAHYRRKVRANRNRLSGIA